MATVQSQEPKRVRTEVQPQHRAVAVLSAVLAVAAYGGAVGLAGGRIDFGPHQASILARIPGHSMALAGGALALWVAVPMTICAVLAWCGSPRSSSTAVLAGGALVAWILVEILIVQTYSWMQPACLLWGLAVAAAGRHIGRSRT